MSPTKRNSFLGFTDKIFYVYDSVVITYLFDNLDFKRIFQEVFLDMFLFIFFNILGLNKSVRLEKGIL